jgi:hypothetical protein
VTIVFLCGYGSFFEGLGRVDYVEFFVVAGFYGGGWCIDKIVKFSIREF